MKSLVARGYVATEEDIEQIARDNIDARQAHTQARSTYLRTLIATAQHELSAGRKSVAHLRVIPGQTEAVERVHARFYAVILRVTCTPDITDRPSLDPEEKHRRALERNRRSGFARSSKSTLIRWLEQPGHNLMGLVAARVTKRGLAQDTPASARGARPARLRRQTRVAAVKFHRMTDRLAERDPEEAIAMLNAALKQIQSKLKNLSRHKAG